MQFHLSRLAIPFLSMVCFTCGAHAAPLTKLERQACRDDYKKFCSEYGLETSALRSCMDRAGQKLSKQCVRALIQAGEVTAAEVERRKRSGR
jgi:hypothetical protein